MKKILILAMISLFLASCVGEAVSKNLEDINIIVNPPTAGLKVELYSGSVLMGDALTNSKGSVTFSKLPVGSYKAVVYDAAGVKITDKYLTSVSVIGPNPFKAYVNVPKAPVTPPAKVCTPGQSTCKDGKTLSVCNSAGTAYSDTVCASGICQNNACFTAPAQVCTPNKQWCSDDQKNILICNADGTSIKTVNCVKDVASTQPWCKVMPTMVQCVQCLTNTECTGGQLCTNNVCTTPAPAQICTPNKLWCEGNILKTCSSNGLVVQQTVCTSTTPFCDSASTKCVGCRSNTDCAAGSTCQNNVCIASGCVKCKNWNSPTNCEWVFKNLCTPLGEGGYPICAAFIFYDTTKECRVNDLGIVPTQTRGTVPVPGRTPVPIYLQYECCQKGVTGTPTAPVVHCPNGIVEAALGEECEPPNTATCDANCKRKITNVPIIHCPNGIVEPALGEQCEPPNTLTCDANCKNIPIPPLVNCPNGVVEPALGEQCEPPNTATCDAYCKLIKEPVTPGIYWVPYSPCAVPTVAGYSSCNLASYNCPTGVHTTPLKCTAPLGTICKGPSPIDLPSIQGVSWSFLYKCTNPPAGSPLG